MGAKGGKRKVSRVSRRVRKNKARSKSGEARRGNVEHHKWVEVYRITI